MFSKKTPRVHETDDYLERDTAETAVIALERSRVYTALIPFVVVFFLLVFILLLVVPRSQWARDVVTKRCHRDLRRVGVHPGRLHVAINWRERAVGQEVEVVAVRIESRL